MKLSVLANLYGSKSLDEALKIISSLGVHSVEIGAGGYPGKDHCDPEKLLADYQNSADYTSLLVVSEEIKTAPFGAVWEELCARANMPAGLAWFDEVKKYENEVLSKRN